MSRSDGKAVYSKLIFTTVKSREPFPCDQTYMKPLQEHFLHFNFLAPFAFGSATSVT